MVSDVIVIANDGSHMEEALAQAEKTARYKELAPRDALHLRLLTEETLGMMRSITGERTGRFWIEDEDYLFRIHLQAETMMNLGKQEQLLAASSSGKNEAARGIMGKIRTFFDPIGWVDVSMLTGSHSAAPSYAWSISSYRETVKDDLEQEKEGAEQAWDELEKSVVSKIADDVRVSIQGRLVEMIILKRFAAPRP